QCCCAGSAGVSPASTVAGKMRALPVSGLRVCNSFTCYTNPVMMPLVLIHGYPFNRTMWSRVTAQLNWKGILLTPDLPGFGDCPAIEEEPALERTAEHVRTLLDAEKIDRAIVCGFSMGGYVALALTELHRDRIAALGLINSQPFADPDEVRAGRRTMIEKVRKEGAKAASDSALPKLFSPRNSK